MTQHTDAVRVQTFVSTNRHSNHMSNMNRKKQNAHSFIVASFNAQPVKGNDMACKRYEISTFMKDNGVDLFLSLKNGYVLKVMRRKLPKSIAIT